MGNGFSIKIEDQELSRALNSTLKATGNLTPVMKAIGEHLRRSTEDNFKHERDPQGRRWKTLKVISYHLGYTLRKGRATHTKKGGLNAAFQR